MLNSFKKSRGRCFVKFFFTLGIVGFLWNGANNAYAEERQQQSLQKIMESAMKAYSEQDYEEALIGFDKALKLKPNDPSLSRLRNEIVLKVSDQLMQKGELKKAKQMAMKVLAHQRGGLAIEAQNRIDSFDRRPKEGFHGYLSTSIEYNSNVASSVDPGNTEPSNSSGYGNRPSFSIGYQGHVFDDYYWDVWAEALPVFWSGGANNVDWQQYNTGVLMGFSGDLWNFSLAYKFSTDVFDSHLNRVKHGVESITKFWVLPNRWQSSLSAGIYFDDFRFRDEADATYYEISWQNYLPYSFGKDDEYSGYVYGGYTFLDNNASSTLGYYAHSVNLMVYIPTPYSSIGLQTGGWLERRNYDRNNPLNRKDTSGSAYVKIIKEWQLSKILSVKNMPNSIQTSLGYFYTETQSAAISFARTEHTARFTIAYYF